MSEATSPRVSSMNELRLRAVRDPDAPPVEKVKAASGWARSGQRLLPEVRGWHAQEGGPAL